MKLNLIVVLFLSIGLYSNAQEDKKKHAFVLYLSAPTMTSISNDKATSLEIGEKAWLAEFGMGIRLFRFIELQGGAGFGSVKDYNPFTQNTSSGEKESIFSTTFLDFKAGLWTPEIMPLRDRDLKLSFGTSAGISGLSGKREIEDCIDCREEKYKFDGGFYIEPEINLFFFQNLLGLGSSYRFFLDDSDMKNSWTILKLMLRVDF